MKKIATILGMMAISLTGCSTQTGLIKETAQTKPTYTKSQSFFVAGIGQEKTVDAAQVCGGSENIAKVESSEKPKDLLLSFVTLGIYTPHTASVYCR